MKRVSKSLFEDAFADSSRDDDKDDVPELGYSHLLKLISGNLLKLAERLDRVNTDLLRKIKKMDGEEDGETGTSVEG